MLVRSLEAAGWVAPTGVEQMGNRPARTVYALTDQGWNVFKERVRRQIREAEVTTSAFVDALACLGALDRAEAPHVLRERQESLEERIAELERASDPPSATSTADWPSSSRDYSAGIER